MGQMAKKKEALPESWDSWRSIAKNDPKRLVKLVEHAIKFKNTRKEFQSQADAAGKLEREICDEIINSFDKSDLVEIKTKGGIARLVAKDIPTPKDWDAIYKHITKTGEFDLLQKRLGERACQERWEAKQEIPGVEKFHKVEVKLED